MILELDIFLPLDQPVVKHFVRNTRRLLPESPARGSAEREMAQEGPSSRLAENAELDETLDCRLLS
jgi:hypothetical protein